MRVNFCQNRNQPAGRADLQTALRQKWPEALRSLTSREQFYFSTGIEKLDHLFSSGHGLPYGQLIEIHGGLSSGKTSLLYRLLARASQAERRIVYVDFDNSFFPDSFQGLALDLSRLLVVQPTSGGNNDPLKTGLRSAELLLRDHLAEIIVFDLVGQHGSLPLGLLHRLRLKTVRARGLVIFLTQTTDIIPSSMASLRLETSRADRQHPHRLRITITKSRLGAEGKQFEVEL